VFARTIGMANDPIGATRQLLDSLAPSASDGSVRIRAVSLGSVNGRYFLFHVGLGFDASVVAEVEKRSSLKRYFGAIVFLGAAVATWAHYDRRTPWFRVRAGGEAVDGYFAIAMKTSPYTFLGRLPFDVAPGTGFDTGLSLVVCRVLTLPTLLALVAASVGRRDAPRVSTGAASLRPGWRPVPLAHSPRVTLLRDLDQVELTAYRPVAYQVDGDYLGEAETLTLRCVPDALRLVVPAAH
jgi:diacylglycerol kinase family enzyme